MTKLLVAALFVFPVIASADKFDSTQSPFNWSASVSNSDKTSKLDSKDSGYTYEGSMMNLLLEQGIKNKNLGTSCRFELEKGTDVPPRGSNAIYNEKVWISCDVKGVLMSLNAIACSYNSRNPSLDIDSGGPTFKSKDLEHMLSVNVICSTKKNSVVRKDAR